MNYRVHALGRASQSPVKQASDPGRGRARVNVKSDKGSPAPPVHSGGRTQSGSAPNKEGRPPASTFGSGGPFVLGPGRQVVYKRVSAPGATKVGQKGSPSPPVHSTSNAGVGGYKRPSNFGYGSGAFQGKQVKV